MRAVPPRAAAPDPAPYAAAEAAFAEAKAYLCSREAQQMSESDLERELHRRGQALMRKLLQGHLDQRSPGEAAGPVAGADRVERSQRRVHERHIETTFGTVAVERVGYARPGDDSLHPLDAALNCRGCRSPTSLTEGGQERRHRLRDDLSLEESRAPIAEAREGSLQFPFYGRWQMRHDQERPRRVARDRTRDGCSATSTAGCAVILRSRCAQQPAKGILALGQTTTLYPSVVGPGGGRIRTRIAHGIDNGHTKCGKGR